MAVIEYGTAKVEVDDEGYLVRFDDWNERVACALAEREGVEEITPERMEILRFMRDHYRRFNSFPLLPAVCRNIHQSRECVREEFMEPLKAWKIAGLPRPGEEALAYIGAEA